MEDNGEYQITVIFTSCCVHLIVLLLGGMVAHTCNLSRRIKSSRTSSITQQFQGQPGLQETLSQEKKKTKQMLLLNVNVRARMFAQWLRALAEDLM